MPELRELFNSRLDGRRLPDDPADCCVPIEASIGPAGEQGEELFNFSVVTPRYLARGGDLPRWGPGLLIVDEFGWEAVERAVRRLLTHAQGETWEQVVSVLRRDMDWEFDNYI